MTTQQIEDKIRILEARHEMFESEIIRVENSHRNEMMIIDLKKKKLKIKDEIETLRKQLGKFVYLVIPTLEPVEIH